MPPHSKDWVIAPPIPVEVDHNLQGYSAIMRQILYNRGYTTHESAKRFLEAQFPGGTEPYNLLGIQDAVDRIRWGIKKEEPIAIYGDYDTDGVTATALLTQALEYLGANVRYYIPNRFDEGYGLNEDALRNLYDEGTRLVITVDCGIRSVKEANFANELGLDLIITDHHHPGSEIPTAQAIINPKQTADIYPDKDLAGVGLAFKLAAALIGRSDANMSDLTKIPPLMDYLDLIALGTVTDLAPLVGENRALVRAGIHHIHFPFRQGLISLMGLAGLAAERVNATDISFVLGPRLNAAGRLDSALAALKLLITNDFMEAGSLAQQLELQNRERQKVMREIQADAEKKALQDDPDALLLFAADPSYNAGVIGLAASRLCESYYRPVVVASQGERLTRGSCRSIPQFHITKALDECAHLFIRHGGHAAAAGFTIENENLPELIIRLKDIAYRELSSLDLRPKLEIDAQVQLSELHPDLLRELDMLQPTGIGNPQSLFVTRDVKVTRHRKVGKEEEHLKLTLTDGNITYDAIAFRQGYWDDQLPPYIDLVFTFEKNQFNGQERLQLNVRDIKPSGSPNLSPNFQPIISPQTDI